MRSDRLFVERNRPLTPAGGSYCSARWGADPGRVAPGAAAVNGAAATWFAVGGRHHGLRRLGGASRGGRCRSRCSGDRRAPTRDWLSDRPDSRQGEGRRWNPQRVRRQGHRRVLAHRTRDGLTGGGERLAVSLPAVADELAVALLAKLGVPRARSRWWYQNSWPAVLMAWTEVLSVASVTRLTGMTPRHISELTQTRVLDRRDVGRRLHITTDQLATVGYWLPPKSHRVD